MRKLSRWSWTVMMATFAGAVACAVAWTPAWAQEPRDDDHSAIEATAGNDALQLRYLTPAPLTQFKSDLDYGLLISDNRDLVGSAAWLFDTNLRLIPRLRFNVGPEVYLAKLAEENSGAFAAAIAGDARFDLNRRLGLSLFGSAAYAPHVLMFGTATNLTDFTAGAQLRFAPRLYGQAGYRWFNFKYPGGVPDDRLENAVFVGLRFDLNH